MPIETVERPDSPNLTPTQELLVQSVLHTFQQAQEGKKLLAVVKGMSGVGKSLVLEAIVRRQPGCTAVDSDLLQYFDHYIERPLEEESTSFFITEASVGCRDDAVSTAVRISNPRVTISEHILLGMDKEETTQYIDRLSHFDNFSLTRDQIVQYSLGIPLLAHQLCAPGLSESNAIRLATTYLLQCHKPIEELQQFLQMDIPISVSDAFAAQTERVNQLLNTEGSIYHLRRNVIQRQIALERRTGVRQESPIFVAPESEMIYAEILLSDREFGKGGLSIYVPVMGGGDLVWISRALGVHRLGRQGDRYEHERKFSNREPMFIGGDFSKLRYLQQHAPDVDPDINTGVPPELMKSFQKAYRRGRLHLPPTQKDGSSCYIRCDNSPGKPEDLAIMGWMIESLLQHSGLQYFVNCKSIDKHYVFIPTGPEEGHLQVFPGIKLI